jgi:hypothetical protein
MPAAVSNHPSLEELVRRSLQQTCVLFPRVYGPDMLGVSHHACTVRELYPEAPVPFENFRFENDLAWGARIIEYPISDT